MTHPTRRDVVVVGGGHNGLVAAAYLARAGMRVSVLEARAELGGAVAGRRVFDGVDAQLSRFSYLVSLLPDAIRADLDLQLELRSRTVKSYTPGGGSGLLIERPEGARTRASFAEVTGREDAYAEWTAFEGRLAGCAAAISPTLTAPLPRAAQVRARVGDALWAALVERPIGEWVEASFGHDLVRGLVLTDALIGTFSSAHDPSLRQNRCFLYHVIGNGTGEWKVPVGGMGAVAAELARAAAAAGADLRTQSRVARVVPGDRGAEVVLADGSVLKAGIVLANCAPAALQRLLGRPAADPSGSQTKVNLVVRRLPRLAAGLDPALGFAGTLHLGQGYARLEEAYAEAAGGAIPDPLPSEVYCHSLTDPSILGPGLREAGFHTLTLFGLHTPAELFRADPEGARRAAGEAALRALQSVLAEPLGDCLAQDAHGDPCVEVMSPLDIEKAVGMPGGHIFHGDLAWPWLADDEVAGSPAARWGVATPDDTVLMCGSGARRGGAVSGLGGHNAAMAVLEAAS